MKGSKTYRHRRRILAWAGTLVLVLGLVRLTLPASAAQSGMGDMAYNIVILIDKSGSMNRTAPKPEDGDQVSPVVAAAQMFVSSLYSESSSGAGGPTMVGVIAFAEETQPIVNPTELSDQGTVELVNRQIGLIEYEEAYIGQEGYIGGTDLGLAVKTAAEMLKTMSSENGRRGIIVLFTDGYTEGTDSEGKDLDLTKSVENLNEGLKITDTLKSEIFVIGFNHSNNTITAQGKKEIWNIANNAQLGEGLVEPDLEDSNAGNVNYRITGSIREIQDFYIKLFAYMMGSPVPLPVSPELDSPIPPEKGGGNGWRYYKIEVDSPTVSLAKVYILSDDPVGEVAVWNPKEERIDLSDKVQEGTGYKLLTLPQPEPGKWYVGTHEDVTYDVRFVLVNGIRLNLKLEKTGTSASMAFVTASYDGEALGEEFYLQVTSPKGVVVSEDGEDQFPFELAWDPEQQALSGGFDVPRPGRYTVEVLVSTSQLERWVKGTIQFDDPGETPDEDPDSVPVSFILMGIAALVLAVLAALLLKRSLQRVPGRFSVICTMEGCEPAEEIRSLRGPSFTMYKLILSALKPAADSESVQMVLKELEKYRQELESDAYRIHMVHKSGGLTYRYGAEHRFLNGEVFHAADGGLTVSVTFTPEGSGDDSFDLL